MRVLVVWARADQPNLGVRALAAGAAIIAREAFPNADVRTHGSGAGAGADPANDGPMNIGHLPPLAREVVQPRRGLREWLTSFDVVVDTRAGDSFSDIYGVRRLVKMSALPELAHRWGVPVFMAPQTIGPFRTVRGRVLARRSLATAAAVCARDPESATAAARLGRPVDAVSTDVVFALPAPHVARTRDVVLNVSGLLWDETNPHVDAVQYREQSLTLVRALLDRGRRVTLLPHVLGARGAVGDNDWAAVEGMLPALGADAVEVAEPASLDDVRQIVGSAAVVVGSRMHACLNALAMGTPVVPMAYSRKFGPLLEPLGVTTTVDLRTTRDSAAAVLAQLDREDLEDEARTARARADALLVRSVEVLRSVAAPREGRG
ncbi:polysaccharide pyruvyl transferase family protein [uncultured Phycicoccus sp.]|uniref:polysaccharide pyruvyl transferase family protein n=1 Tax=uncultured Phycicoccus sp. TaxID=661422 RepID=UPI002604B24A|nr:polysaccharide pyruvyl transferase family protein [uncultured Phycicoccus sp.]